METNINSRQSSRRKPLRKKLSIHYEVIENEIWIDEQRKRNYHHGYKNFVRYIVMFENAIAVALVGIFVDVSIHLLGDIKYKYLLNVLEDNKNNMNIFYINWIFISMVPAMFSGFIVIYLEPLAKGGAIPLLKRYFNGITVPNLFAFHTLILKIISNISANLSGLAGGTEGPMFHIGAIVAAQISTNKYLTFNYKKEFTTANDRRDFIYGGMSAAISICFGAPFAGILIVLEEISSTWNKQIIWRIFMTSCFSVFIMITITLSIPNLNTIYALVPVTQLRHATYQVIELPAFMIMGIIGGLLGAFWTQCYIMLGGFRERNIHTKLSKILEVMFVSFLTTTLGFLMITVHHDCRPKNIFNNGTDQLPIYKISFWCSDDLYDLTLIFWFTAPVNLINRLLNDNPDQFHLITLVIYFVIYFILSAITYDLNVTLGIYIPNFVLGALWGTVFGIGLKALFYNNMNIFLYKYAFFGLCAQLGGILRLTISTSAILIGITSINMHFAFPIVLTIVISNVVANQFNKSVFDIPNELLPIFAWTHGACLSHKTAADMMTTPAICMSSIETASAIIWALKTYNFTGFPVVENIFNNRESGKLIGIITRDQLTAILHGQLFEEFHNKWYPDMTLKNYDYLTQTSKLSYILLNSELLSEINNMTVNLKIFMNPHPYRVTSTCSVSLMHQIFRGLSIRHLIVINDDNNVIGLVTRTNFVCHENQTSLQKLCSYLCGKKKGR